MPAIRHSPGCQCCGEPGPEMESCSPCDLPKVSIQLFVTLSEENACDPRISIPVTMIFRDHPFRRSQTTANVGNVHWYGKMCCDNGMGTTYSIEIVLTCPAATNGRLYMAGGRTSITQTCAEIGLFDDGDAYADGPPSGLEYSFFGTTAITESNVLVLNSCDPLDVVFSGPLNSPFAGTYSATVAEIE